MNRPRDHQEGVHDPLIFRWGTPPSAARSQGAALWKRQGGGAGASRPCPRRAAGPAMPIPHRAAAAPCAPVPSPARNAAHTGSRHVRAVQAEHVQVDIQAQRAAEALHQPDARAMPSHRVRDCLCSPTGITNAGDQHWAVVGKASASGASSPLPTHPEPPGCHAPRVSVNRCLLVSFSATLQEYP